MRGPDSFSILDPKENEVMNIPILNEISSPSHINFDKYQTINIGLGGDSSLFSFGNGPFVASSGDFLVGLMFVPRLQLQLIGDWLPTTEIFVYDTAVREWKQHTTDDHTVVALRCADITRQKLLDRSLPIQVITGGPDKFAWARVNNAIIDTPIAGGCVDKVASPSSIEIVFENGDVAKTFRMPCLGPQACFERLLGYWGDILLYTVRVNNEIRVHAYDRQTKSVLSMGHPSSSYIEEFRQLKVVNHRYAGQQPGLLDGSDSIWSDGKSLIWGNSSGTFLFNPNIGLKRFFFEGSLSVDVRVQDDWAFWVESNRTLGLLPPPFIYFFHIPTQRLLSVRSVDPEQTCVVPPCSSLHAWDFNEGVATWVGLEAQPEATANLTPVLYVYNLTRLEGNLTGQLDKVVLSKFNLDWLRPLPSERAALPTYRIPQVVASRSWIFLNALPKGDADCPRLRDESDAPSCHQQIFAIRPENRLPIIFLPGIAGTLLEDHGEIQDELWLGIPSLKSRARLALDDQGKLPIIPNVRIETGDILRHDLAGFISGTNFYGDMIRYLTEEQGYVEGIDLFTFPYDWRLDNAAHFDRLEEKIEEALTKSNTDKVILLAHSLGGLVSRAYLLSNPAGAGKVESLITMGTPYWGSPKVFYAVLSGYGFGNPFVSQIEMKAVTQNIPSAYQLFPRRPFVTDIQNPSQPRPVFLDELFTIKYKGISSIESGSRDAEIRQHTNSGASYRELISRAGEYERASFTLLPSSTNSWVLNNFLLEESEKFWQSMGTIRNPTPLPADIKHYVIVGANIQTLSGFELLDAKPEILLRVAGEERFLGSGTFDMIIRDIPRKVFFAPIFDDGDGTVPRWSFEISTATATYYVPHQLDDSALHASLPNNNIVQNLVGSIVSKNPPNPAEFSGEDLWQYSRSGPEEVPEFSDFLQTVKVDFILRSNAHLTIIDQATGLRLGFNEFGGIDESMGAFLALDGVEYASIRDITRRYLVLVNGTGEGEFNLQVSITKDSNSSLTFSYPNVQVTNGTTSSLLITPSMTTKAAIPALQVDRDGDTTSISAVVNQSSLQDSVEPPATIQPDINMASLASILNNGILIAVIGVIAVTLLIVGIRRSRKKIGSDYSTG